MSEIMYRGEGGGYNLSKDWFSSNNDVITVKYKYIKKKNKLDNNKVS